MGDCLSSSLLVDSVTNHVKKPYWPTEATTASDSEDPAGPERLRVETKVNVELHPENKLNHIGDRERETPQERDKQAAGNAKDAGTPSQPNSNHQPEQRRGRRQETVKESAPRPHPFTLHLLVSGILKNKISYPPPLTDKNMKNRLREKLSDYNPPTITSPPPNNNTAASAPPASVNIMAPSSRTPSLTSNDGGRPGNHETRAVVKPPVAPRPQLPPGPPPPAAIYRETNGGVAMHLKSGTVNGGNESDSE